MKRICIYVTYDVNNVIPIYVLKVLGSLRKSVDFLVVVRNINVNRPVREDFRLEHLTDMLINHNNVGYDSGAWRDVIVNDLGWKFIDKYDELVLVNDSFFGFIYPIDKLFNISITKRCDYYGITRYPGGFDEDSKNTINPHIESFFLAFKKSVLNDLRFKKFWDDLRKPMSYQDAVWTYEIELNNLLNEIGYESWSMMDEHECEWLNYNEVPYLYYPYELISQCDIPIIKRKCFEFGNKGFQNALRSIDYIDKHNLYDVNTILDYITAKSKEKAGEIDWDMLISFCRFHKRNYIYGAGIYGNNVKKFLETKGFCIEAFIVSDNSNDRDNKLLSDIYWEDSDGVIIAILDESEVNKVMGLVKKYVNESNIIFPNRR